MKTSGETSPPALLTQAATEAGRARCATILACLMRQRLVRRRVATALGSYGSTAFGIVGTVVAARVLGSDDFGRMTLVLGTVALFQLLLDLTSEEALVKYGFRFAERGGLGALPAPARRRAHGEDAQRAGRGGADRRHRTACRPCLRRRADRPAARRVGPAAALRVRGHRRGDARAARALRRSHVVAGALNGGASRRDRRRGAARCHCDDRRARRRAGLLDARRRIGRPRRSAAVPAGRGDAARRRASGDPPLRAPLEHRHRSRLGPELARAAPARRCERRQAGRRSSALRRLRSRASPR